MQDTNYCARHPDTETNLRCGRCDTLVCPQCLVHSPVGVRCPDCGRPAPLPQYSVSGPLLARAVGAGLLMGLGGGLIMAVVVRPLVFGLMYVAAMAGFGYLLGEGMGLAAARKRGRSLQFVAAGALILAYAVIIYFVRANLDVFDLAGAALAGYVAFLRLR